VSTSARLTTAPTVFSLSRNRSTALLLIFETLLMFAPLIILGAAIEWPASLEDPASAMLPRIRTEETMVTLGYLIYLAYSVLILPIGLLLSRSFQEKNRPLPTLLWLANGFAITSAALRTIGILRWLTVMPVLADRYAEADPATRTQISLIYEAVNEFGGGIGEILGVGLFAALWVAMLGIYLLQNPTHASRWLGILGLIAAAFLATGLLETVGVDGGPMTAVSVSVLHLWFLAIGVVLWRRG
jgi:hypothetical protein